MKRLLAVSLMAFASLVLAPSALSTAPTIVRTPINDTFIDDVDCAFTVQIDVVGTDLGIFFENGREFHAFPNSRATLTNVDSGATRTVSIAGPGHISFGSDGSVTLVGTGPALFAFGSPHFPGITLLNGRFVQTFDSLGNETFFSSVGKTRDLCAELAG
jgi:hypothetical protein